MDKRFKRVRSIKDVENDPRIESFTKNYDGKGVHMVEAKEGYLFWGDCGSSIGNIKTICNDINYYLEKQ